MFCFVSILISSRRFRGESDPNAGADVERAMHEALLRKQQQHLSRVSPTPSVQSVSHTSYASDEHLPDYVPPPAVEESPPPIVNPPSSVIEARVGSNSNRDAALTAQLQPLTRFEQQTQPFAKSPQDLNGLSVEGTSLLLDTLNMFFICFPRFDTKKRFPFPFFFIHQSYKSFPRGVYNSTK